MERLGESERANKCSWLLVVGEVSTVALTSPDLNANGNLDWPSPGPKETSLIPVDSWDSYHIGRLENILPRRLYIP